MNCMQMICWRSFVQSDAFEYIAAEVFLPKGDMLEHRKVIGRKRDRDLNLAGRSHSNPILHTAVVVVQYDDGHVEEFAAEPVYAWWVPFVMKRREAKRIHKFGICIPRTVKEALEIDQQSGARVWHG
jgi:hypothetical protein